MKRLVQTSNGWIELTLVRTPDPRFLRRTPGFRDNGVIVTRFASGGWSESDEVEWLSNAPKDEKSLSEFLAEVTKIPHDEAEQIVTESLEGSERGG